MLLQVHDALLRAMSGIELSRVRTELRLPPHEPINQSLLASRGAAIAMQSSPVLGLHFSGKRCQLNRSMQHYSNY
jgi:hypothetical protein